MVEYHCRHFHGLGCQRLVSMITTIAENVGIASKKLSDFTTTGFQMIVY